MKAARIQITVPGIPVPLARHRAGRHGTYLPKRSRVYRELVQAEWLAAGRPSLGAAPFAMSARFFGVNPRSDLDSLVGAVFDALSGLAFADDSQLVCLSGCHKLPADADGARTELELWRANVAAPRDVEQPA
jgi:Holliday junction resolvase RusA-like endonuclease